MPLESVCTAVSLLDVLITLEHTVQLDVQLTHICSSLTMYMQLVNAAEERWDQEGDGVVDDISVVAVCFKDIKQQY